MRKNKTIDDAFRLRVIEEYLSGASKSSLLKKHKLGSRDTISRWLRTFGIEDPLHKETPLCHMGSDKAKAEIKAEVNSLRAEIKRLKVELARERMKSDALDTMIDLAEEMLRVPIRKK